MNLSRWQETSLTSLSIAGLFSRNPTAYKWKAPFRSWILREAVCWRLQDLLHQSVVLYELNHGLGSRVLLRSGFETLAVLIYLNHITRQVLDRELNFHDFSEKTTSLTTGSKDGSTETSAINVLTMLDRTDKRYPGIRKVYDSLSESAHPNWEGLCWGYSKIDHDEYETHFVNRWMDLYGAQHLDSVELCMQTFHYEYNEVWTELMGRLEIWIETNDAELETTK